jgi:hypothetical protein
MANKKTNEFDLFGDMDFGVLGPTIDILSKAYSAGASIGKNKIPKYVENYKQKAQAEDLGFDDLMDIVFSPIVKDAKKAFTNSYKEAKAYQKAQAESAMSQADYPLCKELLKAYYSPKPTELEPQICFSDKGNNFRFYKDGELYSTNSSTWKKSVASCDEIENLANKKIKLQEQDCYYEEAPKDLYHYSDGEFVKVTIESEDA